MFNKVAAFNKNIIGIDRTPGSVEDTSEFDWMIGVVLEELQELKDAHEQGDFVKELDAVTDLLFFATGFYSRMGIKPDVAREIFDAVSACNMNKIKGRKIERVNQHENDAIKPKGWTGPEEQIMIILDRERSLV